MRSRSAWFGITLVVCLAFRASAQQPAAAAPTSAPAAPLDPVVDAATDLVGRPLILRCFCAENDLAFDAAGKLGQPGKLTDWTLAGVNVLKAERKAPGTVELDGVRVAVRFSPDQGEFNRHPMNDEKVKILVSDDGTAAGFMRTADKVFSDGLDLRLQRSMPPYWLHYFVPKTPWPKDGLESEPIAIPQVSGAAAGVTEPKPIMRSEPTYTSQASHDRVQGPVLVQLLVDTKGQPHRPVIVQPLGYGLDAATVEAAEKYSFKPASTSDGKTVAAYVQIRQEFTIAPPVAH